MAKKKRKRAGSKGRTPRGIIFIGITLLIGGIALLKVLPKPGEHIKPYYQAKPPATLSPTKITPPKKELPPLPPPLPETAPARIAILIDDLGIDEAAAQSLLQMDFPLTLSILPSLPHSLTIARLAKKHHREVLLHLPMEPHGYSRNKLYPDILLTDMDEQTLLKKTRACLEQIPDIIGVNNHMGSKFTEYPDKMRPVLKVLKEQGLFFIDSRTSKDSVAYRLAKEMGLRANQRQIFLDNNQTEEAIIKQIMALGRLAKSTNGRKGVIAIAHPHPSTISALSKTLPKLKTSGIEIVPVSYLLD